MWRMYPSTSVSVSPPETVTSSRTAARVRRAPAKPHPTRRAICGFTLPETIIGVVLFAMVMVGVYTGLVQAYHMQAVSRHRDNARAVLRTYLDQFQRLSTSTRHGDVSYPRWLFAPTGGFTGDGLSTTGLCIDDLFSFPDPGPPTSGVPTPPVEITLGSSNPAGRTASWWAHPRPALNRAAITERYALPAQLSRDVVYVNPANGEDSAAPVIGDAGYLIRGTFKIEFTYNRKLCIETLSVMRVVK